MQRILTPGCLGDGVMMCGEEEDEDMKSGREACLKIAQLFLRRMKQEGLVESLHRSKTVNQGKGNWTWLKLQISLKQ